MTGQSPSSGIDQQLTTTPPAHAGLRKASVVIRHDRVDAHLSRKALLSCRDCLERCEHLFPSGQERIQVFPCPAVVLHMRYFQSLRHKRFGKRDHFIERTEILPMHDHIDGERQPRLSDQGRNFQLASVGTSASYPVGVVFA